MGIVDVQQGQGNREYNSPMEGWIVFTSVFPIHPLEKPSRSTGLGFSLSGGKFQLGEDSTRI